MNEGSLKWETLSRNQHVLNNSIARAEGMYNSDCSLAPVLVFLNDHKAETLEHVVAAAKDFAEENNREGTEFVLAAGNAGDRGGDQRGDRGIGNHHADRRLRL